MKKLFMIFTLVMALVINFTSNADAIQIKLPSGPCAPNIPPNPHGISCGGGYTLQDMGFFDESDVWHWNADFEATANIAFSPDWKTSSTPVRNTFNLMNTSLSYREFAQDFMPKQVRVIMSSPKMGAKQVTYKPLYLRECFTTVQNEIPNSDGTYGTHEISIPCAGRTETMRVDIYSSAPPRVDSQTPYGGKLITMGEVKTVEWTEREIFATKFQIELGPVANISYDLSKNFWSSNWSWQDIQDLHFNFLDITPAQGESITLKVTLTDDTVMIGRGYVSSMDIMPKIDSVITRTGYNITQEKDKKSGKIVLRAEQIQESVNNITTRFIDDPSGGKALVIQWPEPDIALFGGVDMGVGNQYQLKVFVGVNRNVGFDPATLIYKDCYLWIDVPPQMGTLVIDAPVYESLVAKAAACGPFTANDLAVQLFYNQRFNPPSGYSMTWQNRGISPFVPIGVPTP